MKLRLPYKRERKFWMLPSRQAFRKGGLGGFEALRKMTREEELKKEASFPPLP